MVGLGWGGLGWGGGLKDMIMAPPARVPLFSTPSS
jgi:hypothetical protein